MQSPQFRLGLAFFLVLVFTFVWGQYFAPRPAVRYPITYTQFISQVDAGNVKTVTISGMQVNGELARPVSMKPSGTDMPANVSVFSANLPAFQGDSLIAKLAEKGVAIDVVPPDKGSLFWQVVVGFLPFALLIGFWYYMMRRSQTIQGGAGGLFQFSASKAKLFDVKRPKTTFADVAGMDNVKKELQETVEFLKDPEKYRAIGAKVPKGVLLAGPPGTGKTLLARATAGEAGVPFYSISGSEFIEMFVGVGASRVRDMFKKARETAPSIIFIDEIDAVGRTRGTGLGGGHDEREQTLNQLLSELDGFDPHVEVIVMAATNRPDVLDPALLRPGRFDRRIIVDRPGWKERAEILKIHVRDKKMGPEIDLDKLAKGTPGMTGADLENLANEAALTAARGGKAEVGMAEFEEARDKILMGTVREEVITDKEKRITAYHEAGHTLAAWVLPNTDPIYKVTIIPRGMAMGVTQQMPEEDRHYYPRSYLMDRLAVALAGMAAEMLVFGETSSGAQSDLKQASALAEKMVAQWGMSDKVGPLSLGRGEEHPFLGMELAQPKRYSEEMAWLMDQEIRRIITDAQKSAETVLSENRGKLDALADALVREEVLDRAAIEKVLGNGPAN
ncbi:MAG: ATP-dependent zinc metalloprotease FtsH [Nitrospirae bacterium]|nr:ATP-dependent zinc metalloprotease FtsH [Nitrospirota bacterium]